MLLKKIVFLMLVFTSINTTVKGQTKSSSSFNYKHKSIESAILKDSVKLVISLPENYENSITKHPVVYILDGKWFFAHGVATQTYFSRYQMTPDLIIVGIESASNQRNWYFGASKKFNQFLETELIPTINKNFRTTNERLLFGWEVSGGFVFEVFGSTPNLFTGYIAASPGPLDKTFMERFQYRHEKIDTLLQSTTDLNSFLYFTTGISDYPVQYGVDNLVKLLGKNKPTNLRWTYKKLNEETHATTPFKTIQNGITNYFEYYPVLRFNTTQDYISKGENTYLDLYYTERKLKYRFSEEKNNTDYLESCKSIIFTAMSDENYQAFNKYVKTFIPKNVLDVTHYNHASMFAAYYLKNNNTKMAIELMIYYINKFPEAARPYNVLGNAFKQLNDNTKAKKNYQKAIDLGTKNADPRLNEYKNNLNLLNSSK